MKIRLAEVADTEAVWDIFHQIVLRGDTYVYAPDTTKEEAIALWIQQPIATYVALSDAHGSDKSSVLGTYYIKPNQPGLGSHVCNCGYMVAENARGQGVATAMARHSQIAAVRLGFKAMQFNCVVSTNYAAIALWQKLGFQTIGTLPGAFQHHRLGYVDAYVMYRALDDSTA